jgi:TolB-like protein
LRKRSIQFSLTALVVALACWGGLLLISREKKNTAAARAGEITSPPKKSIAVLPFANLGSDASNNYFLDGVQDNIITDLGAVADLKVIGRSSVAGYRAITKDAREIGQSLGVSYLLEGSAQKSGDRIRLNARLIDSRSNTQVWAHSYDKNEADLFVLEAEVAQEIVAQLKATLSPNEKAAIERQPTRDMAAYDLYLRAREAFLQYDTATTLSLLETAVARDPQFVSAYCLLAEAHLYMYRFMQPADSNKNLEAAKKAADTAVAIAPEFSDSHLAQAQYYYYGLRDFKRTQEELEKAPFPSDRARFLDLAALTERRLGRWKHAIRDGEKAVELDPHNPFSTNQLLESYIAVRRFSDAEEFADRAMNRLPPKSDALWSYKADSLLGRGKLNEARSVLEQRPIKTPSGNMTAVQLAIFARDFPKASAEMATVGERARYFLEGMMAQAQGDQIKAKASFENARRYFEKQLADRPNDPEVLSNLSIADAGAGRKEEALREARLAAELVPMSRDVIDGMTYASELAQISAWVGEGDAALELLSDLVKLPRGPNYGQLRFDPVWENIRGTPKFQEILARAAQPPDYN